jgi:Flp pilus assembly pilin Flp
MTGKAASSRAGRSFWSRLHRDEAGAGQVEYTLLMAAFGIPLFFGVQYALWALEDHYAMWTYLNGWPFP